MLLADVLGNRGKCAQPCRLPYTLVEKEHEPCSLDNGYLLSTKDLCGLEFLPRLISAGVSCFKIEGRLKNPEYVATVTRIYRKYIDKVLNNEDYIIDPADKKDLMQAFNRGGFSSGHLNPEANRNLVFQERPSNSGIYIGSVSNYNSNKGHIKLQLTDSLMIGDSICFEKESSKYTVSEIMVGNTNLSASKAGDKITIGRMKGKISAGDKIYKISSKELSTLAKQSYENCENRKIPLNAIITIKKDTPISMKIICSNRKHSLDNYHNINVEVTSNVTPIPALKTPITTERIIQQISKTNNTPFVFENITIDLDGGLYIPSISSLNELRRTALENVEKQVINKKTRSLNLSLENSQDISDNTCYQNRLNHPKISLLLNFLSQDFDYTKMDKDKIKNIYLPLKQFINKDYSDIILYLCKNYNLYIYMPTIIRANYKNVILNSLNDILKRFTIKGFVISNIADFELMSTYFKDYEFIGNYSLNVFNYNSLNEYKKLGLSKITLSRELNKKDLQQILLNANIETELIVYGHLPIMTINYCLLGKSNHCYPECTAYCSKNKKYYLKDRLGYEFRIIPDNMQTVTNIYNSKILSIGSKDILVNCVRVDILDETIDEINKIVSLTYDREKLDGNEYTNGNLNKDV